MPQNRVIVIGGATASGKSKLAIDIARNFNGVIVNADASQVYKGIPIISAAPGEADLKEAEHRLYGYLDNNVNGNVVDWLKRAVAEIRDIWQAGKIPVVVGGSGMYIEALINGSTPIPEVKTEIRRQVAKLFENEGVEGLYARLRQEDADGAAMVNPRDTTRVRRAYEIFLQTGVSIAKWYRLPLIKQLPEASFFVIKLLPEREALYHRCDVRFAQMAEQGALDEIRQLIAEQLSPLLPVMRAQGVRELMSFIYGRCSLAEAIMQAQLHTRQYAKRQITWFKNRLKADVEINQIYDGSQFEKLQKPLQDFVDEAGCQCYTQN